MLKGKLAENKTALMYWLGLCTCTMITAASAVRYVIAGLSIATITLIMAFFIGAGWSTVQATRRGGLLQMMGNGNGPNGAAMQGSAALRFTRPIAHLIMDLIPGALVGGVIGALDLVEITPLFAGLVVGISVAIWCALRVLYLLLLPDPIVPLKLIVMTLLSIPIGFITAFLLRSILQVLRLDDVVFHPAPLASMFYGAVISAGLFSVRHVPAWVGLGSENLGAVLAGGGTGMFMAATAAAFLNADYYAIVGALFGLVCGFLGFGIYSNTYLAWMEEIAQLRAALEKSQATGARQEASFRFSEHVLESKVDLQTDTINGLLESLAITYKDKEELANDASRYQLALEEVQETLYSRSFDEGTLSKEGLRDLHLSLGYVYSVQKMYEAATTELKKAIDIDKDSPENRKLYEILVGTHDVDLVVEFFKECGFEPTQLSAEALILEPATKRFEAYREVLVHIQVHSLASRDIANVFKEARRRYGAALEGRLAFIIISGKPDQPVVHQIFAHRLETGLTVIPLDKHGIQHAILTSTCSEFLNSEIGSFVGEQDPYDLNSPITNPLDFFGRNLILDEIRGYVDHSQPIGLFGIRRIGKTSLLYVVKRSLTRYPVAYLDLQYEPANCNLLYAKIVQEFSTDLTSKFEDVRVPELRLAAGTSPDPVPDFEHDVRALGSVLTERHPRPRLVLCLDEVDNLLPTSQSHDGFAHVGEFLRTVVRISRHADGLLVPILCGFRPTALRREYWGSEPNAAHGFAKELYLRPFPRHECSTMMTYIGELCGLQYSDALLDTVYVASGGHPFIARKIGSHIFESSLVRPLKVSGRAVSEAVTRSRRHEYWDFLWEHLDHIERTVIHRTVCNKHQSRRAIILDTRHWTDQEKTSHTIDNLIQYGLLTESHGELGVFSAMFQQWILEERPMETRFVGDERS